MRFGRSLVPKRDIQRQNKRHKARGDAWTWLALIFQTKLCVSFLVGGRDAGWARLFMEDCARRIIGRTQVTTDGHRAYLEVVEGAFGMDCDYAMLQKIYGLPDEEAARRYSPAQCIGCENESDQRKPRPKIHQHYRTSRDSI